MKNDRIQRLLAAALAVAVWQIASMAVGSRLLLASPVQVVVRLAALVPTAAFWQTVLFSLLRIAGGFLLALLSATVLALAAGRLRIIEILLQPYVLAIKSVPVASFIILALIWLKTAQLSLFISFLMVFPLLYTNILAGIKSADGALLEMAQVYGFGPLGTLRHVVIPSVLPAFTQSCQAAIGLCWKAVVAAEVIGVPRLAVGSRLYEAKIYLETDSLLAWTLTIVLLSVLLEALLRSAARRFAEVRHD